MIFYSKSVTHELYLQMFYLHVEQLRGPPTLLTNL